MAQPVQWKQNNEGINSPTANIILFHKTNPHAKQMLSRITADQDMTAEKLKHAIRFHVDDYLLQREDTLWKTYSFEVLNELFDTGIAAIDPERLYESLLMLELLEPTDDILLYAYALLIRTDWQADINSVGNDLEDAYNLPARLRVFARSWAEQREVRNGHNEVAVFGRVLLNTVWWAIDWQYVLQELQKQAQ